MHIIINPKIAVNGIINLNTSVIIILLIKKIVTKEINHKNISFLIY